MVAASGGGLGDVEWPRWVEILEGISHTLITVNSSLNFFIYLVIWIWRSSIPPPMKVSAIQTSWKPHKTTTLFPLRWWFCPAAGPATRSGHSGRRPWRASCTQSSLSTCRPTSLSISSFECDDPQKHCLTENQRSSNNEGIFLQVKCIQQIMKNIFYNPTVPLRFRKFISTISWFLCNFLLPSTLIKQSGCMWNTFYPMWTQQCHKNSSISVHYLKSKPLTPLSHWLNVLLALTAIQLIAVMCTTSPCID